MRPSRSSTRVSASTTRSGSIPAALRAGRRSPVARDLPAGQRRSWAIVVAAPPQQGRAIAAPQDLEMGRAPLPKDAGAAGAERGAGLPLAPPRGSDFSDSDFRFLTVRGRAALAEKPLPQLGGCATRARGCLAPRRWCWGRARQPVDHAALPRTGPGRLVKGLQARLPLSRADHARAALRAHLLGLHCAVHPARRPLSVPYQPRLALPAGPRPDWVGRAGLDCCATRPG